MASLGVLMRAAVGLLVPWGPSVAALPPQVLAGSLAVFPVVGCMLGLMAAGAGWLGGLIAPPVGGVLGVGALAVLAGGRGMVGLTPKMLGATVAVVALAAKLWAAVVLPEPARLVGLVLAPMLGAWAVVVQCYGGSPVRARGPAAALIGRARFTEFGWASVVALGGTLGVADAAGLLVLMLAALATVGLRLWAYRRLGGMTGRLLAATRELVETIVLVTLGLLVALSA